MSSADFEVPDAPSSAAPAVLTPAATSIGGPCAPVRADVDKRCADADRLLAAAQSHLVSLREARRQHSDATRQREADSYLRDNRRQRDEKLIAQGDYHHAIARAGDQADLRDAAATWMHRLDLLNRQARDANRRAEGLAHRVSELERALPGLEMAADAARISAEAAQEACLEARRRLAACEEQTGLRPASETDGSPALAATYPTPVAATPASALEARARAWAEADGVKAAARALMSGDRQKLLGLALHASEETGVEAGRLQLLLIELREQIRTRALDDSALELPSDHPFWSQFPPAAVGDIVRSLASMGYRFDGTDGWADDHSPQVRDLALALSYGGYDPRGLRRPAGQAAIDALWQGTTVRTEDYLVSHAPDLSLEQLVELLGPGASRLSELWDIWGRLRPLLMKAGYSTTS
jgi:hypothetical protein